MRSSVPLVLCALILLAGCAKQDDPMANTDALIGYVQGHRVGSDRDQWIEMRNSLGDWEKTGLVFGYVGDLDECQKAIAGLKKVNYAREYRCEAAN